MIRSFNAPTTDTERSDVPVDKAKSEGVWTGIAEVMSGAGFEIGVWEHGVGRSQDSFGAEVFVVLQGVGRVTDQEGDSIELRPGVVGILPDGALTDWDVSEPIRKVWIVRGS